MNPENNDISSEVVETQESSVTEVSIKCSIVEKYNLFCPLMESTF